MLRNAGTAADEAAVVATEPWVADSSETEARFHGAVMEGFWPVSAAASVAPGGRTGAAVISCPLADEGPWAPPCCGR